MTSLHDCMRSEFVRKLTIYALSLVGVREHFGAVRRTAFPRIHEVMMASIANLRTRSKMP